MKKKCLVCGKKFKPTTSQRNMKYCSIQCRRIAYIILHKKRTKKQYPTMICPHCSKLVQLHFDLKEEWNKRLWARCPKCHKSLFNVDDK